MAGTPPWAGARPQARMALSSAPGSRFSGGCSLAAAHRAQTEPSDTVGRERPMGSSCASQRTRWRWVAATMPARTLSVQYIWHSYTHVCKQILHTTCKIDIDYGAGTAFGSTMRSSTGLLGGVRRLETRRCHNTVLVTTAQALMLVLLRRPAQRSRLCASDVAILSAG